MQFDLISLIKDVGFPIAVTVYTLYVLNKSMKENTTMIQENTRVLTMLCTKMNCDDVPKEVEVK